MPIITIVTQGHLLSIIHSAQHHCLYKGTLGISITTAVLALAELHNVTDMAGIFVSFKGGLGSNS